MKKYSKLNDNRVLQGLRQSLVPLVANFREGTGEGGKRLGKLGRKGPRKSIKFNAHGDFGNAVGDEAAMNGVLADMYPETDDPVDKCRGIMHHIYIKKYAK